MLIEILVTIALISFIACLIAIIISYIWARRQNGIFPKTMDGIDQYRFDFQKIVDKDGSVSGYEALLRQYSAADKKWLLPEDITKFTLREIIYLLSRSAIENKYPEAFLAINISIKQFVDPRYVYFIDWLTGEIYPMNVHIEFQIDPGTTIGPLTNMRLKRNLNISKKLGVKVILEQVSPDIKYYKKVKKYLKMVSGVKIPLSKFQKTQESDWFYHNIGDWVRISKTSNVTVDLTEIEEFEGVELADLFEVSNRQGYLIGKPEYLENSVKTNSKV
ncbi:EAL domain-containing protein [Leuconostoc lactis]|uniref:EAL domain-containing protein n=1 Tax=Leuconostoc lactis TaxID=1246 RepID=UPI002896E506|nr:EAL domain-containing protein [Leuconostoc lactis]